MTTDDLQQIDIAWPDVPRTAFRFGEPAQLNACMAWALGDRDLALHGYAEGYKVAASALLARVRQTDESPDYVVWPIAFLWRHHVELGLKRIIACGLMLHGEAWAFPKGHRLRALWDAARPYIEEIGDDKALLANVEANIDEMEALDPTAAGFRYPFEVDQKTLGLKCVPEHVNLVVLDDAMQALSSFLDAVHAAQEARLDALGEMEQR